MMNRYGLIKTCRYKIKALNSKLQNINNYNSTTAMLKDVSKLEAMQKEIEIQECYIKIGK